jgi:hypothetical protein
MNKEIGFLRYWRALAAHETSFGDPAPTCGEAWRSWHAVGAMERRNAANDLLIADWRAENPAIVKVWNEHNPGPENSWVANRYRKD